VGDLGQLGRVLIVGGAALLVCGLLFLLLARVLPGGRLPGNIVFSRGPVTCLIPLATSLLLSVILTILLNLWTRR
jgi:Protein of unknown function (DUF2905)